MSAYQSAQALASQAQEMVTQTKTLLPSNTTSATTSIIFKVANDLSQLENTIETKSPFYFFKSYRISGFAYLLELLAHFIVLRTRCMSILLSSLVLYLLLWW